MKRLEKIEKYLLTGFLVLIPTQLGKHWWPEWSLVNGNRVDYLSPTLYLTDVVWVILITVTLIKVLSGPAIICLRNSQAFTRLLPAFSSAARQKKIKPTAKAPSNSFIRVTDRWWLTAGAGLVLVNVFVAENMWTAGYGWLRWLQWGWVVWYLIKKRDVWRKWFWKIAAVWVTMETGLGLAQVLGGRTVQGVFYWLGERKIETSTIGAATWSVLGEERLRSYGTFSHPNSLAGFLGLVWLLNWQRKNKDIIWWLITVLGGLGMVLTGGRTVIVVMLGLMVVDGLGKAVGGKEKVGWVQTGVAGLVLAMGAGMVVNGQVSGWDEEGMNKRWELLVAAGTMVMDYPLLGVGLNNYLGKLPYYWSQGRVWLQPVHNVVMLMVAELGLAGAGLLTARYGKEFLKRKELWLAGGFVLLTGMADHYWISLVQNRWLVAVVLGLLW